MDLSVYKGTHGTCRSCAESIQNNGFNIGKGLRGSGAYFWPYNPELASLADISENLAISWWLFEHQKGSYSSFKDKLCAVIDTRFNLNPEDIFEFEIYRDQFIEFCHKVMGRLEENSDNQPINKECLSGLYDTFISLVEKKNTHPYKAIKVRVQAPKKFSARCKINSDILGQPECMVIKDANVISIEQIKNIDVTI